MVERSVGIGQLLEVLPDLAEFDALRQALRQAAVDDPGDQWRGSAAYRTVDRRLIAHGDIGAVLTIAEAAGHLLLKQLYDATSIAFSAVATGSAEAKTAQLVALAENAESMEHWRAALSFYLLAHAITIASPNLSLRALLARRVARAALNTGDYARAAHYYANGLAIASTASDVEGQLVATTGLGNLASLQGRWREADDWYAQAMSLCGAAFARERAQLLVNRSMTAREGQQFDEAFTLLEEARHAWHDLTDADRAGWHNNKGLLELAQANLGSAEISFLSALRGDPDSFHKAMVLDNLAEVALLRGNHDLAEGRCREAEEYAIAHGSPRGLAQVYMRLGRVACQRGDANAVAFFEKARDLARGRAYPLLQAEIACEYAAFRSRFGETAAARALLEEALQLLAEIGATTRIARVQQDLAQLTE